MQIVSVVLARHRNRVLVVLIATLVAVGILQAVV
jgi:hypothetical protein